ncbi:MAG: S-methyl-5-thioribose-1-phosphate isomerase [Candidatus Omnitrophica bacterium]|nr:S-methyl-5-thioribose-1-phosphate isomerase [Candidatus Omnitrophota bacterium]
MPAIKSIDWKKGRLIIIDQRQLPQRLKYLYLSDVKEVIRAIKRMSIRGAPALAGAAAFGLFLGIKDFPNNKNYSCFKKKLNYIAHLIGSARPTAVNLFWALERMLERAEENKEKPISQIKIFLLKEARQILEEDRLTCRKMAKFGCHLVKDKDRILTICNAGILATVDYGTALGVIYEAVKEGKEIKVFSLETRPLLQGARLTTWELKMNNIDVTLICDNMAAELMRRRMIDKIFVGADRIALNGDTANKIGTYNLAVLADFHKIPFYVVAPLSSFDPNIDDGSSIPIEERTPYEVTSLFFKRSIAPRGIKVLNPAFDVTPHNLITAFVTEKGIIKAPFKEKIKDLLFKR